MTLHRPYTTPAMHRQDDAMWATMFEAVCPCGAPITEDRGARNHLGENLCRDCEDDNYARECRYE